jgi:agmatine deiminase
MTDQDRDYRMPAEWEPMAATWLVWPQNRSDWPGRFAPIPFVYTEIVRNLARVGRVEIIVNDEQAEAGARKTLEFVHVIEPGGGLPANLRFHRWPTNRGWTRDSGPIFVRDRSGEVVITNWRFNGWAKYRNWQLDDQLPQRIAGLLGMSTVEPEWAAEGSKRRVVLEGGSIDVNGRGLLLATEECLLSRTQQRNPGMSRKAIECVLGRFLGARKVLWLECGIAGDDTHGHVDDVARFVSANTVVAAVEPDPADANHEPLRENLRRLRKAKDLRGRPLRVIPLPMPSPVVIRGRRVPASYANFYIFNGIVLAPTFSQSNDRLALNTLADAMPKHTIIPVHCGDLIWGLGALHCMTQQQPF